MNGRAAGCLTPLALALSPDPSSLLANGVSASAVDGLGRREGRNRAVAIHGTPRAAPTIINDDECATNRPARTGSGGCFSAENAGTTTSQVYPRRQAQLATENRATPVP